MHLLSRIQIIFSFIHFQLSILLKNNNLDLGIIMDGMALSIMFTRAHPYDLSLHYGNDRVNLATETIHGLSGFMDIAKFCYKIERLSITQKGNLSLAYLIGFEMKKREQKIS